MTPKPDLTDPLKFYNGEVTLYFDKENWKYYLQLPNGSFEPQSGVTGVCGIIDKSSYLMPWSCKMMYLKILREMPRDPVALLEPNRTRSILWTEFDKLLQDAKTAHKEYFEEAGDVGTAAHTWIENTIRNAVAFSYGIVEKMNDVAPTDERSVNCGLAAFDWMQKHNVRWISTERKIYSRQYKYAGTCDGTALVDSCDNPACCSKLFMDELSLIDWKSSNQLSVQYLYQTAAYQNAIMEEDDINIKARWILRLGKEDGKFEAWYETHFIEDFAGYLACLTLSRTHKAIEKRMAEEKKLKTFHKRAEKKEAKQRIRFVKRKPEAV